MNRETATHSVLLTAVLGGLGAFLYCLNGLLQKIDSWEIIWNPPQTGELLMCGFWAIMAVGAAMGLNVRTLLGGLGLIAPTLPTTTEPTPPHD